MADLKFVDGDSMITLSSHKARTITLLSVALLVAACGYVYFTFDSTACMRRWSDSKYQVRYEAITGCRVQVDGDWVPESSVQFNQFGIKK